ncbi:MAG: hypothetical protein BroJett033_7040 [Chloroflexota bacterium]|nr:MAG: hypothetical protein BroJett033_7040 [Chloroflexota bacterium]
MRNRLVSTVGTSLFSNINGDFRASNGVTEKTHALLKGFYQEKNWGQLAKALAEIPPDARVCGAEINSIAEAVKRQRIALEHIHFFVSDTEDGRRTGDVLETYIIERGIAGLRSAQVHVIEALQDGNPKEFKVYGLRNLVRELGTLVNQFTADAMVIDATGGYKAQIAIAVVFGQALEIPVLYRHERFSEIIDFPPMPITFNYDLLGQNADLLAAFENKATLTLSEVGTLDDRVRVLLEEVKVNGESLFALGAVGQIFLTGFRLRFPRARELTPVTPEQKQPPHFRDDHYPDGFKAYVTKVCSEVPWIKTAHSLPYHGQRAILGRLSAGVGFYVYENKLVGLYGNRDFGARFEILTAATGNDQLTWAADQLNQQFMSH